MKFRWLLWASPLLLVGLWSGLATSGPADDPSAAELAAAVKRGDELFHALWTKGGKTCATCHAEGSNRLTNDRLRTYPKYEKAWQKVISGQQKLNQMIRDRSGGEMLVLGSPDLNALEAYVATMR